MHYLDLTFGGFALRMAPVLAVVLVVEYVVLRLLHRADLEVRPTRILPDDPPGHARTPVVAVLVMLVGFAVLSPLGVEPFWVSGATAVVLVVWGLRNGVLDVPRVVRAAHPGFAVFVLCLGVVVAALATGPLGDIVADALPETTSYAALLGIALLATLPGQPAVAARPGPARCAPLVPRLPPGLAGGHAAVPGRGGHDALAGLLTATISA